MKRCFRDYWFAPLFAFYFGSVNQASAQTFTVLYTFSWQEGANPSGGLVIRSNTLFGTTTLAGQAGNGVLFRINTDGTDFAPVHTFIGSDGATPLGSLALSNETLYGVTKGGGAWGRGTVYKVNIDGTGFQTIYNFTQALARPSDGYPTNIDGINPIDITLSGTKLYGAAEFGGPLAGGTVFSLNTDGTGFTTLHGFGVSTNTTPWDLRSGVICSGSAVYGTTENGGVWGGGSVFTVNTDGTGFTNIYNFSSVPGDFVNTDGGYPIAALVSSGNILYGTTIVGGSNSWGTVFSIRSDGADFANLYTLTPLSNNFVSSGPLLTNSDGSGTAGPLIVTIQVVCLKRRLVRTRNPAQPNRANRRPLVVSAYPLG